MSETQKAYNRRVQENWHASHINCSGSSGIDIGCGNDLVSSLFVPWDITLGSGDAQKMAGVPDEEYLTVYASHILEHLDDPVEALLNWYRILKPGGRLIVIVPHRDLYEQKTELPSQWAPADHKTYWLPDHREGKCTWGLRETIHLALPSEGWEIETLRVLDTLYESNFPRHPLGEYSIECVVKKKMTDKPIYKALVTELLSEWASVKYHTDHKHIAHHLKEVKLWVEPANSVRNGEIFWDATRNDLKESNTHAKFIIFDCQNPNDNEWAVRFFRKHGYELHAERTKKVLELNWGCKVMEKVRDPITDLVTVVVPTYNSATYIEECLDSILKQTHKNLEVIVVDDFSDDSTIGLVQRTYNKDERFHWIIPLKQKVNAGAVRQVGVDEAVGDFICCFDSDDIMHPEYLACALEVFEEGIDFVYPRRWWLIPEQNFNKHISRLQDFTSNIIPDMDVIWRGVVSRDDEALLFQNTSDPIEGTKLGSCMIMPTVCRSDKPQVFDPELTRLQDWDMHNSLMQRGKGKGFFCAPYIRNRVGSITNSGSRSEYERCRNHITEKYNFPKVPKLLILPLNSNGEPEKILAGPRIRGHRIAPHIPNAEVGDLNTLRYRYHEFDAFYFVCAPTPAVTGWIQFLMERGKRVIFDVCVEYWSQDYQFQGYQTKDFVDCLHLIANCAVTFICASEGLAESLCELVGWGNEIIKVIEDSIMPSMKIKESYEKTGLLSWCGAPGNITSLLAYSKELIEFTEKTGATIRLITDEVTLRIPFNWQHRIWSPEIEEDLITYTDIYLLPQLDHGSFKCKGRGKLALASSLGMPIVEVGKKGWQLRLDMLLNSEEERKRDGFKNLKKALNEFVTPLAVEQLIEILNKE